MSYAIMAVFKDKTPTLVLMMFLTTDSLNDLFFHKEFFVQNISACLVWSSQSTSH